MRRMHCALCRDWRFQQTAHGSGTAKGTTIRFARHPVLKLGLCYDFQLVPQVPTQPHDVRMDGILTDKRLVLTADEERMEWKYE